MPYEIRKMGSQFVVVKKGTNRAFGRHATKAKARRQLRALYASERGK